MRHALTTCIISALVAAGGAAELDAQRIIRRGGESTISGQIKLIDDAGVSIESDLGARHDVPWDRIREVISADHERQVERYMETADALWRARSRVERNDVALAEPLFERLFEKYRGQTHETALVAAEGLLRCRLARGAHALAVIPALEVTRLHRTGVKTVSYSQLAGVMDARTGLCMVLAPYWIDSPVLPAVLEDLRRYDAHGDEVVASMARLYLRAVARAAGRDDPGPGNETLPDHAGVNLLEWAVDARSEDSDLRRRARDHLLRGHDRQPVFVRAWARFFVGLSLLEESGVGRQQRGLMNLLHVPALHHETQRYLAGISLALVADALAESKSADAAATLRDELASRYPNHPVRNLHQSQQ